MATNYNGNPNMTSNVTGWGRSANSALSATSEGGKWTGGAVGAGVAYRNISYNSVLAWPTNKRPVLGVVQIRRDHASAGQLNSLGIQSNGAGFKWQSQDLKHVYFPVGKWIQIPLLKNLQIASNGSWFINLDSYAGYVNYTVKGFGVYRHDDVPADALFTDADAAFTANVPPDSLSVDFSYTDPLRAVDGLYWFHEGVTLSRFGNADEVLPRQHAYVFPTAGTYPVKLRIQNTQLDSQIGPQDDGDLYFEHERIINVTVPSQPLTANFNYEVSYLDVDVDAGISIGLDRKPGVITETYDWDWGDGSAHGTTKIADHTYAAGGDFPITLTVSNSLGQTSTITRTVHIDDIPTPIIDFTADKNFLTIQFIPTVNTGGFLWNFGDGETSTDVSPIHTFDTPGLYNVTLTYTSGVTVGITREILVYESFTMIDSMLDALRLEIAVPPQDGEIYNYIKNPNGEQGSFGYTTPALTGYIKGTNQSVYGIDGWKMVLAHTDNLANYFVTEKIRCDPNEWVNWTIQAFGDGFWRGRIEWYNNLGVKIGEGLISPYYATGTTRDGTPQQAPANTYYCAFRVDHYATNAGANPTAAMKLIFRRVMLARADTQAELTPLAYSEGNNWLDLMGDSFAIKVSRRELDLGILGADIRNGDLDPSKHAFIRPGQPVRLRAATQDLAGNTVYENIFRGETENASVSYDRSDTVLIPGNPNVEPEIPDSYESVYDPDRTVIALIAYDNAKRMGSGEARGLYRVMDLPYILEGKEIPWNVNGSSESLSVTPQIVSYNENAKLMDQVVITRDTDLGYAWIDRNNVFTAYDPVVMPQSVVGKFDEADYSDIEVDFDTDAIINSVKIKWLYYTPDPLDPEKGQTVEMWFGPYEDQESIDEWGFHQEEFTVHGLVANPVDIEAWATDILGRSSTPRVRIHRIEVPIYNVQDIRLGRAVADLYDLVNVKYSASEIDEDMRVVEIDHDISHDGWKLVLGFKHNGAVASVQNTPSPPPPAPVEEEEPGIPYDTGWITPALSNSWVPYGATTYHEPGYRRIGRVVYLRGAMAGGANNAVMFTLPADMRPAKTHIFLGFVQTVTETTGAASAGTAHTHSIPITPSTTRIDVQSDGVVKKNQSTANNGYVFIDGISFALEDI